jgi:type III restriction enzyme
VDLSATPFYIEGSGNEVGQPFPWVVSDFGLLESIEAGLVKIPQLPTDDSSGEETPAFFNVSRWVEKRAQQDGHIGPIGPAEIMRYATAPIILLAAEWRRTLALWKEHLGKATLPP